MCDSQNLTCGLKMQRPDISTLPLLIDVITEYCGLCGIAIFFIAKWPTGNLSE